RTLENRGSRRRGPSGSARASGRRAATSSPSRAVQTGEPPPARRTSPEGTTPRSVDFGPLLPQFLVGGKDFDAAAAVRLGAIDLAAFIDDVDVPPGALGVRESAVGKAVRIERLAVFVRVADGPVPVAGLRGPHGEAREIGPGPLVGRRDGKVNELDRGAPAGGKGVEPRDVRSP